MFKKVIILMVVLISVSFSVNAGFLSKGVKYGATTAFVRFAVPAITRGVGKKTAGWALKKLKSKSFTHFTESMAVLTFVAVGNEKYKNNIKDIMASAGVLTDKLSLKMDEDSAEFSKAKAIFTEKADNIDKKHKKRKCDTYKLLMTKQGYPSDQMFINDPVQEWNVGSFGELYDNAVTNDKLDHDHIPSKQAIKNFLENKGYKMSTNDVEDNVDNNTTTIEIKNTLHRKGATYAGRQGTKIEGLKRKFFDSKNLRLATIRDMSYHYINSGGNKNVIKSFFPLYKRNLELCLYN
jgi:hypothetical protein